MNKRKTIDVNTVRKYVNAYNEGSEDSQVDHRGGINSLLTVILHQTDNYNGYGYVAGYGPFDGAAELRIANPAHDESRRIYH